MPDPAIAEKLNLWNLLQENGRIAYANNPLSSCSVDGRGDRLAFGKFSRLHGRVLDVGCGPQSSPSYVDGDLSEFVGIDPLPGVQPRPFKFVQAIGEYLPFKDAYFDRVLFATSLDHMIDPGRGLREAARVTKKDGMICIWDGHSCGSHHAEESHEFLLKRKLREWSQIALPELRRGEIRKFAELSGDIAGYWALMCRIRLPDWRRELKVPEGAADAFHMAHTDEHLLESWIESAQLSVIETTTYPGAGAFLRVVRDTSN